MYPVLDLLSLGLSKLHRFVSVVGVLYCDACIKLIDPNNILLLYLLCDRV